MVPAKSQPIALIVCPNGDRRARTLAEWAARIIDELPSVVENLPRDTGRAALESALAESKSIAGLIFFCHGQATALGNREILLDRGNIVTVGNRVLIAIACHSARELGVAAVNHGVAAYVGFTDRLHWDEQQRSKFGEAINAGIIAILRGKSVEDGCDIIRRNLASLVAYFKDGAGRTYRNILRAIWQHIGICSTFRRLAIQ